MKLLRNVILAVLLCSVLSGPAFAQSRVATVDLRKVFDNYWKKKQADAKLNDQKTEITKQLNGLSDELKKAKEDYQKLQADAYDMAVSAEERDRRRKMADAKATDVKDTEAAANQFLRQADAKLAEQYRVVHDRLLDEIRASVTTKAKSGGFALVVDATAETAAGAPIVLFTSGENDLTDAVLSQLNAGAPLDMPGPAEKKDAKKDEKK